MMGFKSKLIKFGLRLHVAANARSTAAENKLLATEKALQDAKKLVAVREKENQDMQNVVGITKYAYTLMSPSLGLT
jgi:hypothetical protein